jgi:PAS domain
MARRNGMGFDAAERTKIETLACAALAADWAPFAALFAGLDAPAPAIGWIDPAAAPARLLPSLAQLLAYWTEKRGARDVPRRTDIDPVEMRGALGDVHLLRADDDGWDMRCLVYGTNAGARARIEMTGKRISELPGRTDMRIYFMALYRAAATRRQPIFARHTPPMLFTSTTWDRINLPIDFDDGTPGCITGIVGRSPGDVKEPPPV